MGATKRMSNGEAKPVGPHPSTIRVSAPYMTQARIEKLLFPANLDAQEKSHAEAREDNVRLQGVQWLDIVRRQLQLPVKTYTTACVYYHKFRLAHPIAEYHWTDAAAASLLTSCKNEDTLKKSRDILAAAHNAKQSLSHEQLGSDDPIFEAPSRLVICLERLVLESGGFDFRGRAPHAALALISKSISDDDEMRETAKIAHTVLTDLHRTFAPLKQTSATLALASLELAAEFQAASADKCLARDALKQHDTQKWCSSRQEVMETLLDALDLYTHHTGNTILGTKYSLDDFLRIRLALNKECDSANHPRYTTVLRSTASEGALISANTLRVSNGHPTPVSPSDGLQDASQAIVPLPHHPPAEGGGTLRFILDPQRALDEKAEVKQYYIDEWEEYDEEIEVPDPSPRVRSPTRDSFGRDSNQDRKVRDTSVSRPRDHAPHSLTERTLGARSTGSRARDYSTDASSSGRRSVRGPGDGDRDSHRSTHIGSSMERDRERDRGRERDRIRESNREREREREYERAHLRDRDRDRRYDDYGSRYDDVGGSMARYDDRARDRRYDDRRDRDRERDRRYDDRGRYEDDRRRWNDWR